MAQTFIIEVNPQNKLRTPQTNYDFWRVSCKRATTALDYLKGWVKKAEKSGYKSLYSCFFIEGATYRITATPDGYHTTDIVAEGTIEELMNEESGT